MGGKCRSQAVVSPVDTLDQHLAKSQLHRQGNHTAVVRPRSFGNIYHFLEGSSQLIRLAMMPYVFPPVGVFSFA